MGTLDYLLSKQPSVHRYVNHRSLYLLGLATIACGLAWSNLLMSLGQFILIGNWIIEFRFKEKWKTFLTNPLIIALLSLYLLHLLALLWTNDFDYAFKDLRIKLPLLILPFVIGTSNKLNKEEWLGILSIYAATILLLTFASLYKFLGFSSNPIIDKRQLSIYISHIRYGLNITFCIFLLWRFKSLFQKKYAPILIIISCWLIACLFLYQMYTGVVILLGIASLLVIQFILFKKKNNVAKGAAIFIILSIGFYFTYTFIEVKNEFYTPIKLTYDQEAVSIIEYTQNGNKYSHDLKDDRKENGVYIRRFVSWREVEREWNKRSELNFRQDRDMKGQLLDHTLLRFLSSKGVKKDSVAITMLTQTEIEAIEQGIANVYYIKNNPIKTRIHKTLFEFEQYQNTGDADGYSSAMRLEFWATAKRIIEKYIWIGTGTGDIKEAFKQQYIEDHSMLDEQYRRRAHNQYLTFFAAFGILGFSVFLFYLIFPLLGPVPNRLTYLIFWGIMNFSFLTEDTLETQAGVTLFAFFNTLLLLGLNQINIKPNNSVPTSS